MTDNLPPWPGAAAVYSRVATQLRRMAAAEYQAWRARRKPRASDRFVLSADLRVIIDALNTGDEETLKAFCATHRLTSADEPQNIARAIKEPI